MRLFTIDIKKHILSVVISILLTASVAPASAENLPEAFELIDDIISSDVEHGFPAAQLAVIKDNRLIYSSSWGDVTPETLFDLASNTKMYGAVYAIQHLVDQGKLDIDTRIVDIIGDRFADDVLPVESIDKDQLRPQESKTWKRAMKVRDVLSHRAGFIASPKCLYNNASSPFYSGIDGSAQTRKKTLDAICRMPLMYKPGGEVLYSDVDYLLLCFIIEKISGQGLQEYLNQNFWKPLELKHITFNPLQHGFKSSDCAPTELHGNTRDGAINFPGVRTYTLQGEVHDEKAWHSMGGVSGHAGLFANAEDLARLANLMINGKGFFSDRVITQFTAPISREYDNWGLGWWRQGKQKRTYYFGTHSSARTIGHQGWTGTLTVIDPESRLVIAFLTNKINSPVTNPKENPNKFDGNWYTSSTLGFVAQIIGDGLQDSPLEDTLESLFCDRAKQYVQHPCEASKLALDAIAEVWEKWN